MYKFQFYVPEASLETVKKAIFEAGAGTLGEYSQCSWQCLGEGQFYPSENSNPNIGNPNKLETVREFSVETVIADNHVESVLIAFLEAHPYETPAYSVWKVLTFEDFA